MSTNHTTCTITDMQHVC